MSRKKFYFLIAAVLLLLSIRLFCGVYVHDEFGDEALFIKHRPTWKWKFYSPVGMSDLKMEDLTPEQQTEQEYFDEFVGNRIFR